MKLLYTPEGEETQTFQFMPKELPHFELEAIEDVGRPQWATYVEWTQLLFAGGVKATRAVLWILLRREDPELEFDDVAIKPSEIDIDWELDDDEAEPDDEGKDEGSDDATSSP